MKAPDKYVERNREELLQRSLVGVNKYGVTIENSPQRSPDWAQHAIEEALDLANYLQALKDQCVLDRQALIRVKDFMQGMRRDFGNLATTTVNNDFDDIDSMVKLLEARIHTG